MDRAVEPLVPCAQLVEPPDGVLDAPGAIGGERREQRQQREHEQEAVGVRAAGDRDQQADGRQARVDQVDRADHAKLDDRGDAAADPFPGRRDQQVARALGDQRHRQHGPVGDVGRRRAGRREDEARGDRVERVGGAREHPLGVRAAAEDVEQLGRDQAGRDARGGPRPAAAGTASARAPAASAPRSQRRRTTAPATRSPCSRSGRARCRDRSRASPGSSSAMPPPRQRGPRPRRPRRAARGRSMPASHTGAIARAAAPFETRARGLYRPVDQDLNGRTSDP